MTLDINELKAKHEKEIKKLEAELKAAANLPEIPGARLRMVHGKLYGVRHFAFDVVDLSALLDFIESNALPAYAIKGKYSGMYPEIPNGKDWENANKTAEGLAVIDCSRAIGYGSSGGEIYFFMRDTAGETVKLSFTAGGYYYTIDTHQKTRLSHKLAPVPQYRTDIRHHDKTERPLSGYLKSGEGVAQFIFHNVDKQGADLKTLCTIGQLREYWTAE